METWLLGALAGGTAAFALIYAQRRSTRTANEVLPLLRERGPLTIPEIMRELGIVGFAQQGKVVTALDSLIRQGKVEERPAPLGTPTAEKVNMRTYAVRTS